MQLRASSDTVVLPGILSSFNGFLIDLGWNYAKYDFIV